MKLPEQFRHMFGAGQTLDETIGAAMAEWATGVKHEPNPETLELARAAAGGGSDVFKTWWKSATADERRDAKTIETELKVLRDESDARQSAPDQAA